MNCQIILLNAPRGAGKDTIAGVLNQKYGMERMEFKAPMFRIASAMVGLSVEKFMEYYNDRNMKENPSDVFFGMSARELLISISEDFCKPKFGKDYFGKVAANSMDEMTFQKKGYVFSDSGFLSEVIPAADKFGRKNMTIVQFTGQGSDSWVGDSRSWVYGESEGIATIRLEKPNENIAPEEYTDYLIKQVEESFK